MIYECTDCQHCASFADGFRVLCCNPEKPANSMINYHPVGEGDAIRCKGFDDSDSPVQFPSADWDLAVDAQGEDGTYDDMRKWVTSTKTWRAWRAVPHE